jgi:DNA-binding NarL/FixJ family response regulator
MNILIVDDERMSRTVIARLIAKKFSFCKVSEAQNGIEALAMLEQETFDLLIADLNMPGMGGLELVQVLRNDIKYQKLPIIIVSIVQDKNIIVKLIQLGIAGFLSQTIEY